MRQAPAATKPGDGRGTWRHHTPEPRRRRPEEVRRWIVTPTSEEVIETCRERWTALLATVAPHRERLGRVEQRRQRAGREVLGLDVAKQTVEQFAARALVLQLRTTPLGRRLPPIPADVGRGSYFRHPVHLLDLATPVIRDGLTHALAQDAEAAESPLGVLVADVRAELAVDPVRTTKLDVYHALIAELVMRAYRAGSRTARQEADTWLTLLAPRGPDGRADARRRHHRPAPLTRERRHRRAERLEAIAEAVASLADACRAADPATLPPPLRIHRTPDF